MVAASAQPAALPSTSQTVDYRGSLAGQNGPFAPASPRRFMGPPISSHAGSFGSRFHPGAPPGQFLGQTGINDFHLRTASSSIDSNRGSLLHVLNVFDRQEELCRGVNLPDTHAPVDHFEDRCAVAIDSHNPQGSHHNLSSAVNAAQGPLVSHLQDGQQGTAAYTPGSFDPGDMELDMEGISTLSSGASSPPDTPIMTPLTAYPSAHHPSYLNAPSTSPGLSHPPISVFDTATVMPSHAGGSTLTVQSPHRGLVSTMAPRAEEAFNTYPGHSELSPILPGTVNGDFLQTTDGSYSPHGRVIPPALLFNRSAATSPSGTPDLSRVASPVSGAANVCPIQPTAPGSSQQASGPSCSQNAAQTARASTTLSRPASSLLLSKPFECPKPNYSRSHKQRGGLKHHMTHGSCNFAPPEDPEQLQALLASRQKDEGSEPFNELSLCESEKEAERRLRPYACSVGDCQRRYKHMNGLRYHYQHSGDHGAIGLALLASAQHECLQTRSHWRHVAASNTNSQHSSPPATPIISHTYGSHHHHQPHSQSSTPPSSYSAPPSYWDATRDRPTYTLQS